MVAGVVAAPQIELLNEDLIRAHIHAIWLSNTVLPLSDSMTKLLDTSQLDLPLFETVREQLTLTPEQYAHCLATCERVLATDQTARWLQENPDWLVKTLQHAPVAFDQACDRWRELFVAADRQLTEARAIIDRSYQRKMDQKQVKEAERRQNEAYRQKSLLCNSGGSGQGDTDFYPYRYFASEGFLPGYNFPRLPVRSFLPSDHDRGEFLSRPRFLALREFGPDNVIYHEGNKYKITRTLLPAGSSQKRFFRAQLCKVCGHLHKDQTYHLCENCQTPLQTEHAETLIHLFEMSTVATQRVERITCEEEERRRQGFTVTTHYQFARDQSGLRRFEAEAAFL
ncbi:MAG: DEAD/DEAH box helicase, partial [Chloroflexaceae bacterium]|nr:DEAD/DEAH box helicase [Chloroflexaceae bacterium]